ncbi:MAG TPA: ABC transporter permease, partial [Thermoanaerobaculia bacterium]|nr:ABC transporter permease [Thermoanaerobaculia bacterium]
MTGYLLRRLAQMIPTALLAATLVFSLIHLIPGDPVEMMLGEGARRTDVEALRHDLGLDRPLLVQYGSFLVGLVRGDLGTSLHSGEPVRAV